MLSPALLVPGLIREMPDIPEHSPAQPRRGFVLSALDFSPVQQRTITHAFSPISPVQEMRKVVLKYRFIVVQEVDGFLFVRDVVIL